MELFVALLEAMNLNQCSISAAQPGLAVERTVSLLGSSPSSKRAIEDRRAYCRADCRYKRCRRPGPPPDRTYGGIPHPVDCRRGEQANWM